MKGKQLMNQDNRVLGRKGARELSPGEVALVTGAVLTETKCTIAPRLDGDRFHGECGTS
jgi:hypothetical protein